MPEQQSRPKLSTLSGGVSTQAPNLRLPGHVAAAQSAGFSVFEGIFSRPGTRHVAKLSLTAAADIRMHAIHRNDSEQYLLLHGGITPTIITAAGTTCTLYRQGAAANYIAGSSSDQNRLVSIADYTVWCNNTKPTALLTSPDYSVDADAKSLEVLQSRTPGNNTYHRVLADSDLGVAGYYRYNPGPDTFPTIKFATQGATWSSIVTYKAAASNPMGFRVFFVNAPAVVTGMNWTAATKTLKKVGSGAFANLTVTGNNWVNITAAGTPGYYKIATKVSADEITLTDATFSGIDLAGTVAIDGTGLAVEVRADLQQETINDMYDVAAALERRLRDSGASGACLAWTFVTPASGYFTLTGTQAGTRCTFPATSPTRAPLLGSYDLTQASHPFIATGSTITAGGGSSGPNTVAVGDRWTRVPAPNQAEAVIDASSMPCALARLHAGGAWPKGSSSSAWAAMTKAMKPAAWWRLGEASGTIGRDEMVSNPGTYAGSYTLAQTGAVNGDSNTAVSFTHTSNGALSIGTLGTLGAQLGNGFTVECAIKTTSSATFTILDVGTGTATRILITANDGASDRLQVIVYDEDGLTLSAYADFASLRDGNFHSLAFSVSPSTNTVTVYADGASITRTYLLQQTPANFKAFRGSGNWMGTFSGAATVTLDEPAIHMGVFTSAIASARHNQRINSTYSHAPFFMLNTIDWVPRYSGDKDSNPAPYLLTQGKPIKDVTIYRDRLTFIGGDRVSMSTDGDYYNLFIDNIQQINDADPIERQLSAGDPQRVAELEFAVPIHRVLMLFSSSGQQFQLSSDGSLTPASAAITVSSTEQTVPNVRPRTSGNRVFFAGLASGYGTLFEYAYDDNSVLLNAANVSAHVERYIPNSLRTIGICQEAQSVLMLPSSGTTVYVYRFFYNGLQKVQSAWTAWVYNSGQRICDVAIIRDNAYMLFERQSQYVIERQPMTEPAADSGLPVFARLDHAALLTGSFSAGTTTWTLPNALSDTTVNAAMLSTGQVIAITSSGTTATATGNYSANAAVVGRLIPMNVELSRPFPRDQNGVAEIEPFTQFRQVMIAYKDSGPFTVRAVTPLRDDRVRTFTPPAGSLTATGTFIANVGGDVRDTKVTIETSTGLPVTVSAAQLLLDIVPRS